ncbi:hypothetical protein ACVOMT_01685 [Sphingomonas panni]
MFGGLAKSLFGSSNDRYVKSLGSIVDKINGFEPTLTAMSDAELAAQTPKFREQLANGAKLDSAAARSLRHRPRSCAPRAGDAAFRCADGRRHRAAPGRNRRDAHR